MDFTQEQKLMEKLIDKTITVYDEKGIERFYIFDDNLPNYKISLLGNLKGYKNILTTKARRNGELKVRIKSNDIDKTFDIKVIMAQTFLKKKSSESEIYFIDGNPKNTHISNIAYREPIDGIAKDYSKDYIREIPKSYRKEECIDLNFDEEFLKFLKYRNVQFFDNYGEEIFYFFDKENFPMYSVSLFGRVKGYNGILNPKGDESGKIIRMINNKNNYIGKRIHNIMIDTFFLKDSPRKTEIVFLDGNKRNTHIFNLRLVDPHCNIKNPEELFHMKKLILSEECKKRLKNPDLPVYDQNDQLIFYDMLDDDNNPNGYKVSMTGRILGPTGIILSNTPGDDGYIHVVIYKNNIRSNMLTHRIVAKTFLINPDPLIMIQVNHINWDTLCAYVDNLEYVTSSENNKKKSPTSGNNKPVIEVDLDGNIINTWDKSFECLNFFDITYYSLKKHCINYIPLMGRNIRYKNEDIKIKDSQFKNYVLNKNWIPIVQINSNNEKFYWCNITEAAIFHGGKDNKNKNAYKIRQCIDNHKFSIFSCKWLEATDSEITWVLEKVPVYSEIYGNWKRLYIDDINILVSDLGFVINKHGQITIGSETSMGYLSIIFNKKGYLVHRLVIRVFEPEKYSDELMVDHMTGERKNNALWNLRYATPSENSAYARGIPVMGYNEKGEIGPFPSISHAARFVSGDHSNIGRSIKRGGTSYGYHWKVI